MTLVNLRAQSCATLVFLLIITNLPVKSWPICSQSSQSKESCQCTKFRREQITIKTRNNNINNRNDGCYYIYYTLTDLPLISHYDPALVH